MSENNMAAGRGAVSAFATHCEWTGAISEDREKWLQARRAGVGGSDVAAIIGVDDRRSALEVYVDKISDAPPTEEENEIAEWGRLLEPVILKRFEKVSGRRVVRGGKLLRAKQSGHHLCTLDGVMLTRPPPGCRGPGVAEVKTTGYGNDYAHDDGDDEQGVPESDARAVLPVRVQIQLQWQLHVTGAEWGTVVWLPLPERRMQSIDMVADRQFQAWLVEQVDQFWRRVKRRIPPAPDGSESSARALNRLYPGQGEEVFRLLGATSIADEYQRIGDMMKVLQVRKRQIRNVLAATMGEARHAVLDDGRYWGASAIAVKDKHCPHCAGVIGQTGGYRSFTLRAPRKKAFVFTGIERALAVNLEAENDALTKALSESLVGAPEPSNDPEKETA